MAFLQDPPQLPHPYRSDRSLLALLDRALPAERRAALDADLDALGDYALMAWQRACTTTRRKPVLTQWDAWGRRVDRIELTPAWQEGAAMTTRHAVLAAGHDDSAHGRLEEFARVYLYHLASEFYTCPLAMTDGAATALKASGNSALIERVLAAFPQPRPDHVLAQRPVDDRAHRRLRRRPHRDRRAAGCRRAMAPVRTQVVQLGGGRRGGTDPGAARRRRCRGHHGAGAVLRRDHGRRTTQAGTRDRPAEGQARHAEVPTAEIPLDGLPAWPLGELANGVRQITPMLNVTRTWNAICAVASMARALAWRATSPGAGARSDVR